MSRKQKNEDGANGTAAAATHRIVLIKHAEYGVVVMIPDMQPATVTGFKTTTRDQSRAGGGGVPMALERFPLDLNRGFPKGRKGQSLAG